MTLPELTSPLAPSPAATSTNGLPGSGAVPLDGVKVRLFTGGWLTPLLKTRLTNARSDANPSRVRAYTASTRAVDEAIAGQVEGVGRRIVTQKILPVEEEGQPLETWYLLHRTTSLLRTWTDLLYLVTLAAHISYLRGEALVGRIGGMSCHADQ